MKSPALLVIIKIVHTAIWLFFNVVLIYLFFAVTTNRINKWVWIGFGSFLLEGIVLLIFRNICPLTILARRYSDSEKDNFDIYLPLWLAKHNKLLYGSLLTLALLIFIYRLLTNK